MRSRCLTLLAVLALAACGDSQGPGLNGPALIKIAIDGQTVPPVVAHAGCGDYGFILSLAPLAPAVPNADVLEIRAADLRGAKTFTLANVSTGRFARTYSLGTGGLSYQTDSVAPGRLTITGVDFTDSVVAGTFSFRLVSTMNSATTYDATGSFRQAFTQVFTVANPGGTTCQARP
ncbi:MAG: hypothetical protein ABI742_13295 [Gemmatimonadota bacterium]